MEEQGSGRTYPVGGVWADGAKMLQVPGIDRLGLDLDCALQKKRVVNATTGSASCSCLLNGLVVSVFIKRNDGEPISRLLHEKEGLLGRDDVLDRQSGHRRVNFGERMRGAR